MADIAFCVFQGLGVKSLDPEVVLSFLQSSGLIPRHSIELQRDSSLPYSSKIDFSPNSFVIRVCIDGLNLK